MTPNAGSAVVTQFWSNEQILIASRMPVQTEGEEIMTIFVQNDLKLNDKVILLRAHGGKQYIVLDKVKET